MLFEHLGKLLLNDILVLDRAVTRPTGSSPPCCSDKAISACERIASISAPFKHSADPDWPSRSLRSQPPANKTPRITKLPPRLARFASFARSSATRCAFSSPLFSTWTPTPLPNSGALSFSVADRGGIQTDQTPPSSRTSVRHVLAGRTTRLRRKNPLRQHQRLGRPRRQ